jgi:hypothetical protein
VRLLSTLFKLLRYKRQTIYRKSKRFEKQEHVERKIGFGRKCAPSSFKARAALKKQTEDKSSSQHCEKVFDKGKSPPQSQKIYT